MQHIKGRKLNPQKNSTQLELSQRNTLAAERICEPCRRASSDFLAQTLGRAQPRPSASRLGQTTWIRDLEVTGDLFEAKIILVHREIKPSGHDFLKVRLRSVMVLLDE